MAVDVARLRDLLEEERRRVLDAIEYLQKENPGSIEDETDDETTDNHLAETATVTLDREIDYTLEENSEHVLSSIDGALGRIDDGTYGNCLNCRTAIAEDRLAVRLHQRFGRRACAGRYRQPCWIRTRVLPQHHALGRGAPDFADLWTVRRRCGI